MCVPGAVPYQRRHAARHSVAAGTGRWRGTAKLAIAWSSCCCCCYMSRGPPRCLISRVRSQTARIRRAMTSAGSPVAQATDQVVRTARQIQTSTSARLGASCPDRAAIPADIGTIPIVASSLHPRAAQCVIAGGSRYCKCERTARWGRTGRSTMLRSWSGQRQIMCR